MVARAICVLARATCYLLRAIIIFARAMLFSSAETLRLEIAIYLYDLYLYDYAFPIWVKLRQTVKL